MHAALEVQSFETCFITFYDLTKLPIYTGIEPWEGHIILKKSSTGFAPDPKKQKQFEECIETRRTQPIIEKNRYRNQISLMTSYITAGVILPYQLLGWAEKPFKTIKDFEEFATLVYNGHENLPIARFRERLYEISQFRAHWANCYTKIRPGESGKKHLVLRLWITEIGTVHEQEFRKCFAELAHSENAVRSAKFKELIHSHVRDGWKGNAGTLMSMKFNSEDDFDAIVQEFSTALAPVSTSRRSTRNSSGKTPTKERTREATASPSPPTPSPPPQLQASPEEMNETEPPSVVERVGGASPKPTKRKRKFSINEAYEGVVG